MERIVVCDTGPLLHLSEAGAIHLLQYAGRILIPESVAKEFNQNAQGWNPPQWIEVHELDKTAQNRSTKFIESNIVTGEKPRRLRWRSKSKQIGLSRMTRKPVNSLNPWDWNHTDQSAFCFGIWLLITSMGSKPEICLTHL